MDKKQILQIKHLQFAWPGSSGHLLDIPHFEMNEGESVFIYGSSGSGKSTLLNLLSGVLRPTGGEIAFLGKSMSQATLQELDLWRADAMGLIFQNFNLLPYLTALDNVLLPLSFSKVKADKLGVNAESAAIDLLLQLGLDKADLQRKAKQMSMGQQQRVAAARALLGEPRLLIADEPTSSLDWDNRERFLELLFKIAGQSQTAILFVSHDQSLKNMFGRSLSLSEMNEVNHV